MDNNNTLPLKGITIIELGTNLAVPAATRILADWGAEVIKVEDLKGDPWRNIGIQNYGCPIESDENPIFAIPNANKKFVSINIKTSNGIKAMKSLLKNCDVFVSNIRAQGLERLGLDYESVKELNPNIIYTHFSGYGSKGEEATRPGYDLTAFWARSGALIDWSDPESYPMKPSGGFGDFVTSMSIAAGILAAVIGRTTTGMGTKINSSLYGSSIWYNGVSIVSAQEKYGNEFPKSKMNPHNPFASIYQCSDNEWIITTINQYNQYYNKVCGILEMNDLIDNEDYNTIDKLKADKSIMQSFIVRMVEAFKTKTCQEWFDVFNYNDLPCEKLVHHKNVSTDEQAKANGYIKDIKFENGEIAAMPSTPIQFSSYNLDRYDTYSRVGLDTAEVLKDNGFTDNEIEQMSNDNSIGI